MLEDSLDPRPTGPNRGPIHQGGLVCTFLGIGAFVEFERGNYVRSFTCAISAAAAPTSIIAFAIDGWLKHHRWKIQGI